MNVALKFPLASVRTTMIVTPHTPGDWTTGQSVPRVFAGKPVPVAVAVPPGWPGFGLTVRVGAVWAIARGESSRSNSRGSNTRAGCNDSNAPSQTSYQRRKESTGGISNALLDHSLQ